MKKILRCAQNDNVEAMKETERIEDMKLQQAMDRVDEMRPNMQDGALKIAWLSELDGLIWQELIVRHWMTGEEYEKYPHDANGKPMAPEYDTDTDPGTELLVPAPRSCT